MAAAGAIVKRKMSVVQVEKQLQKKYSAEFVRGVLERHDTGRSGGLTWNELKEFLHALHPTRVDDITEGEVRRATHRQADRRQAQWGTCRTVARENAFVPAPRLPGLSRHWAVLQQPQRATSCHSSAGSIWT